MNKMVDLTSSANMKPSDEEFKLVSLISYWVLVAYFGILAITLVIEVRLRWFKMIWKDKTHRYKFDEDNFG